METKFEFGVSAFVQGSDFLFIVYRGAVLIQ